MKNKLSPTHFAIELPRGIIDSIQNQPVVADVRKLFLEGRHEELSEIPVSVDRYGKVISRLGHPVWHLWPYLVILGCDELADLDFRRLPESPELLLEMEMLHYVWLRIRGSRSRRKRITIRTLYGRFTSLILPLRYLQAKNLHSIAALCEPDNWAGFKIFLADKNLGFSRLYQIFSALKAVAYVSEHLPFPFRLPSFEDEKLSRELAAEDRKENIQIFSIPPRLADLLYGDALAMVEAAWPHRERIAELVQQKDDIHRKTKEDVNRTIDSPTSLTGCQTGELTENDRDTCSEAYRKVINARQKPLLEKTARELLFLTGNQPPNRLLAACFISTVAFSAMRPSEAYQLQPGCYAARIVDKMTFHVLLAATTKPVDGIRPDEWLCSPGAGKAVELAEALTRSSRKELLAVAEARNQAGDRGEAEKQTRTANCLWLEHTDSYTKPKADFASMRHFMRLFADAVGATVTKEDVVEFRLVNREVPASRIPQVGQIWPFSCRQMRRTFAVFARRYNLAGIPAIKQQLKHLSARVTERYCNGASEARLADARRDPKLMAKISKCHIDDQVTKPVPQGRMTYQRTGPAGHINGYRCEMEGVVFTIEHALNWQVEHTALVRYLNEHPTISENEYCHYITKIRAAEKMMTSLGISFVHYRDRFKEATHER